MLTIKHFSRITAIPETALRFYEEQGVLLPAARSPAGYRLYSADQVLPAKFFYSLRLAAIPMAEVKAFQEADQRQAVLARWQGDLRRRIAWLQLAEKYVETLMGGPPEPIHLQLTESDRVLWFTHDGPVGRFTEIYARRGAEVAAIGLTITDAFFRWVANVGPDRVRGQVGFQVDRAPRRMPAGAELEDRPASLTLTIEHKGPMEGVRDTYSRLFAFMDAHGWTAVGPAIERYPLPDDTYAQVLCPILYLEGSVSP